MDIQEPEESLTFFVIKSLPVDWQYGSCIAGSEACRPLRLTFGRIEHTFDGGQMGKRIEYTKELLEEAVAASISTAGVLRYLGLREGGGTHAGINRRIKNYEIDTSHFRGMAHQRGRPARHRLYWSDVLTVAPIGANRKKTRTLRRALLEHGRPHECEMCGIGPEWLGSPLALHIDHVDGNPLDSRPENLRFLCPNCHTQTPTWAARNIRRDLGGPLEQHPERIEPAFGEEV